MILPTSFIQILELRDQFQKSTLEMILSSLNLNH